MSVTLVNNSSRRLSSLLLSRNNQSISFATGRFNFHTSTYVFAKDSKKPGAPAEAPKKEKATSQAKPTATAAKTPQPTQKPSQAVQGKVMPNVPPKTVLQGENMPRTVIRAPESLQDIKNNIAKLCDEEIEFLSETSGVAGAVSSEFVKEFLSATNFEISESEDGVVTLTKRTPEQVITITFDKYDEESSMEQDEEEEQQQNENEEGEEKEEQDVNEGEELPYKQNLTIEIAFVDKTGNQKGRWSLYGFAGKDSRLYINDMSVEKGEKKQVAPEEEEKVKMDAFPFQSLSDDMQDRLYDYLDEVGVDDQLANFVKRYLVESESRSAAKFLENLKDLMRSD